MAGAARYEISSAELVASLFVFVGNMIRRAMLMSVKRLNRNRLNTNKMVDRTPRPLNWYGSRCVIIERIPVSMHIVNLLVYQSSILCAFYHGAVTMRLPYWRAVLDCSTGRPPLPAGLMVVHRVTAVSSFVRFHQVRARRKTLSVRVEIQLLRACCSADRASTRIPRWCS